MNLGQKMRQGAIWLSTLRIASRGLEFIFGIVLARLLAPADFGLLVNVQIFTGIAGFFADGGMGQALVRKNDIKNYDVITYFTAQLGICCAIYAFFLLWRRGFPCGLKTPFTKTLFGYLP